MRISLSRNAPWCIGSRNLELVLPLLPGATLQSPFPSTADTWSLFRDQTLRFINAVSPLIALWGVGINQGIIALKIILKVVTALLCMKFSSYWSPGFILSVADRSPSGDSSVIS